MNIGVFDSGFGGLTVLRALLDRVPTANYHYLGDSARLPYGSKSPRTVAHYAASSARYLVDHGADLLVIACNTASALALDAIRESVPQPVIGVIEPGAAAAAHASHTKRVCVVATHATIASRAYTLALAAHGIDSEEKACPLLVPLVEEGWIDHPVTQQVLRIYLDELAAQCAHSWSDGMPPDAIVLGCTHYPLLKPLFSRLLPRGMHLIDSADAVADEVATVAATFAPSQPADGPATPPHHPTNLRFSATDSLEKFRTLGQRFLGRSIRQVELITLPE